MIISHKKGNKAVAPKKKKKIKQTLKAKIGQNTRKNTSCETISFWKLKMDNSNSNQSKKVYDTIHQIPLIQTCY